MGARKRKRQSTDSAIADMSSQGSFESNPNTHMSTQSKDIADSQQSKRRRSSLSLVGLGLDLRNFGTAASQRPRRAAPHLPPQPVKPPNTPHSSRKSRRYGPETFLGNPSRDARRSIESEPIQSSYQEVKEDSTRREQTPERIQPVGGLLSPPETIDGTNSECTSQTAPRRSVREQRPPARSQRTAAEEDTRTKKKIKARALCAEPIEGASVTPALKSRIVRLRIPISALRELSMSFTGSFSHRQKTDDPQESSHSQKSHSLPVNSSFQQHEPETFAQPQPEPILADSQETYSSQLECEGEVVLPEYLPINSSFTRDRFTISGWISRHDGTELLTDPQRQQSHGVQHVDNSWQTQPTQPLHPPGPMTSSAMQQSSRSVQYSSHASQATTIDEEPATQLTLSKRQLHDINKQLFAHRTNGPPKPAPVSQPPVWADSRMDLCETLHYFRSYQGACYSTGGFVRGFMFDNVAGPRDYIDTNVVIARAGGGHGRENGSGELKALKDQVEGVVSQNLRNCMSHYNPVVIITGADNPQIPSQPPHQYCVLDYFKPTHIWSEKSGGKYVVRYRFEKLNARKESWWRANDVEDPIQLGSLPPPFSKPCGTCARESVQIYLNGWMCLYPTCGSFWLVFPSGPESMHGSEPSEPDECSLVYDPRFLKSQTAWPNDRHIYPLTSNDATTSSHAVPGEDTSEAFTRGVVCPLCGRCTSRLSWTGWECTCGWTKTPTHTLIPALSIREPLWPLSDAYTASRDIHSPLVSVDVSFSHGYRINRYALPGIDGFVTHMIANGSVITEAGGSDDMFEALQKTDIGLRRRPIDGSSMVKGGIYTRHSCVNYGMPYKFIAATESHPFPAGTHPINSARARLNWAARHILSQSHPSDADTSHDSSASDATSFTSPLVDFNAHPFNEVLALGYFTSQRISYHDDGEAGLGPTIATLSLGAPGTMRIRLKAKHHTGVSGAGYYTDSSPLPGCASYAARLALASELEQFKATASYGQYRTRLKQIPKELGLKGGGHAKDAVTLKLGHGDVVVMHGEAVQRYYEHAVEHSGCLRFALTCRYIEPEILSEGDRLMGEGFGGGAGEEERYDGLEAD